MRYKTIIKGDGLDFDKTVEEHLNDGWELHGPPMYCQTFQMQSQVVIKNEPTPGLVPPDIEYIQEGYDPKKRY